MKHIISIWLCILLIFSGITLIIDVPEVQGAFITWPGDHIIDGISEYYGPGDVIDAGGDIYIRNDGKLILDGAVLNFTAGGKSIWIGGVGNGTFNITGGGETKIDAIGEYGISAGRDSNLYFNDARIIDSWGVRLGLNANARINEFQEVENVRYPQHKYFLR